MAERRSIYTQVTELTSRIKQQARTSWTAPGASLCAQFVVNIVEDIRIPQAHPLWQKMAADLRKRKFAPEPTAPTTMTFL